MDLEGTLRATLGAHLPKMRGAVIAVSFYPYVGVKHTIRRRGRSWLVRISDHCRDAPPAVLEAVALILSSKIMRLPPPEEAVDLYRRYLDSPAMRQRILERRLHRGRKRLGPARGRAHRLDEIFRELNRSCFAGRIEIREIGWGLRRAWRRLGHYDPVHRTITVSPVLDSPAVPRPAVAYVVYHEMLHSLFDEPAGRGGKKRHGAAFRLAERSFPGYAGAREFLDRFCRERGRAPFGGASTPDRPVV